MIIRMLLYVSLSMFLAVMSHAQSTLTVYAPDYFASEWGPGPQIEKAFEQVCDCDVDMVAGDPFSRLKLEGDNSKADIVIGLSSDVVEKARASGLFKSHGIKADLSQLPIKWNDELFLPFNWSYVSFVYKNKKIKTPPRSFIELAEDPEPYEIVIQDPRTSPAGLSLILWVKTIYGDQASDLWSKLSKRILTVTKGWSEAYGMFTSGEVDMVLSFNTSPAYHQIVEDDNSISAAIFDKGHYVFLELVGIAKNTKEPELSAKFMDFVLSPEFQKIIPLTNWSYPVRLNEEFWPKEFIKLPKPKDSLFMPGKEAERRTPDAIKEWLESISQ